jgi:dihydroorotate dehydrogenase
MGEGSRWYRLLVRPALFALPPESSHRLVHRLLGLPLPWERLGGVRPDPATELVVTGLPLANPIGLAAGFDKTGAHVRALGRLGFGYVVAGTFTRRPRRGNPRPRVVRRRERDSLVNAMGLPNPGAEVAAATIARRRGATPTFASIADEAVADVVETHALFEPVADAIELNASCPNVSWGRDRDNEAHLAAVVRELGARRAKPLFVKLPPFRTAVEREVVLALARIAQEGGVDGLTCSNSLPVDEPRLAVGSGGLSGADLWPTTLDNVRSVRAATGGALPIHACGGVATAAQAVACIEAGATTVQVYTGLVYRGPRLVADLVEGVARASHARAGGLAALVGSEPGLLDA